MTKPHTPMEMDEAQQILLLFDIGTQGAERAISKWYIRIFGAPRGEEVLSTRKRLFAEAKRAIRIHRMF